MSLTKTIMFIIRLHISLIGSEKWKVLHVPRSPRPEEISFLSLLPTNTRHTKCPSRIPHKEKRITIKEKEAEKKKITDRGPITKSPNFYLAWSMAATQEQIHEKIKRKKNTTPPRINPNRF